MIRNIVILFLSNLLIYSVVRERIEYNGLITWLWLYPIKYLNELYLPYCSFLETNILLISISSILNIFFVYIVEGSFLIFLLSKFMFFPFILIYNKEKKWNFFYNN